MKTDREVHLMLRERKNGKTLEQAAARAGMSVPTARKYRTHANPFELDWPWVEQQLQRDPALQAKTLFVLLCEQHPARYVGNGSIST
jgi:hypothetical protein